MFFRATLLTLALAATAFAANAPIPLHRRTPGGQVPISCNDIPPETAPCACPLDLNHDTGVVINIFPGYQCAYPGGACTWSNTDGALQNTAQTNCPTSAPCGAGGCNCPIDNNVDTGVIINQFAGYQCAYPGGACTWDFDGNLSNTMQTNCPKKVPFCPRQ